MMLEKRYREALAKIGGASGLLLLPEGVKRILKQTTDLEAKVKMLELIAEKMQEGRA